MRFQKLTRCGYEYRIYAEDGGDRFPMHGAIFSKAGYWIPVSWCLDGRATIHHLHGYDLLPEKKRRFKTAQELVDCLYAYVSFNCYGLVTVKHMGLRFEKRTSDTPEGNYAEDWLNVFTTTIEEDV